MKAVVILILVAFGAFAWFSLPRFDNAQSSAARQQTARGKGLVLALDREKGAVTISHDAMPALNMPPMTMEYTVKNRGQLETLQPMQKVEFEVGYDGKDYLITDIR